MNEQTDLDSRKHTRLGASGRHAGARHLRGVVVGVRADADGAQDRDPARYRGTDRTLSDFYPYPFGRSLQGPESRAPNDDPFAGPNHQIADGLRRGVPEQAVEQLLFRQGG